MYEVRCHCGESTPVRPSLAGQTIQCGHCGDRLAIPPLSTLRRCAERGEPAPASDVDDQSHVPSPTASRGIPESAFVHFHGMVGSKGRVSVSAMENYASLISRTLDEVVESTSAQIELMVSCALTPDHPASIWIETIPFNETRAYVRRVMAAETIFHWRMTGDVRRLSDTLPPLVLPAEQVATN